MNEHLLNSRDILSILVVEDDVGLSRLIKKRLERSKFRVSITARGDEAVEYATQNQDILLLLDFRLEDMTGREVLDQLQARNRDVPFIVMTGNGDERIAVEMMKLGARDYLVKDQNFLDRVPSVMEQVFTQLLTERKLFEMEQALRESEHQFRTFFNSGSDAILVSEIRDGKLLNFIEVNDIACKRLGFKREELLKLTLDNVEVADGDEDLAAKRESLIRDGHVLYETFQVDRNGNKIPVETSSQLIDLGGKPAVLSHCRDLTDRKQLEDQLRQSHKMEAIGKLAGGVAHDFNNLLTAILGYSELLLVKMGEDDPYREGIREIKRAGERAASLTMQLLAFSRKQVLKPRLIELNSVVSGIEKMLKRIIGENIELNSELEQGLCQVKADRGQVEQIILNMAVNAGEAMQEGGQLTIKTSNRVVDEYYCGFVPDSRPGRFVCLSISDTGEGMDKATQRRIFEPFFTTKKVGTGLGLSVVYGNIKQHNGWITVYSEAGQGTTFEIYLPAVLDETDMPVEEETPLKDLHGNQEKILFVEDEEGVRKITVRALRDYGYNVIEAVNAQEALDIFQSDSDDFALVFSDIVLADKSGIDLVEELRTFNPGIKILLTSGYADKKSRWSDVIEKGLPFLQKPYSLEELLKNIREVLV